MTEESWIIGSNSACDLVVKDPIVSGRHCRLARDGSAFLIEDLGSTNGTYVNGRKAVGPTTVTPDDRITLGVSEPMPWPDVLPSPDVLPIANSADAASSHEETRARTVTIGRSPDNNIILRSTNVSSHHARLTILPHTMILEDLGSTNGTSLGTMENKILRSTVELGDTVFFGSAVFRVSDLLSQIDDEFKGVSIRKAEAPPRSPVVSFGIWFLAGSLLSALLYALMPSSGDPIKQGVGESAARSATPRDDAPATDSRPPQVPAAVAVDPVQSPVPSSGTTVPAGPQPGMGFPQAVEPPTPAEVAQSRLFWVLAADPEGEPAFRLGVAWTFDGQRLVTTASVIDALASLDAKGLSRREVVHCTSGRRFPIRKTGVHPLYANWLQRSRELETEYNTLRPDTIEGDDQSDLSTPSATAAAPRSPTVELAEQLKQIASEELALRDRMVCYDVGWLTLDGAAELDELATGAMANRLPRARQPVSIASVGIDIEDPYYDATARNAVLVVPARVHALVRPPDTDTGRAEIKAEESLSDWNFSGAPVLDESGRVIGMFVQPTVDLNGDAPENLRSMADLALPAVINECLHFAALSAETLP